MSLKCEKSGNLEDRVPKVPPGQKKCVSAPIKNAELFERQISIHTNNMSSPERTDLDFQNNAKMLQAGKSRGGSETCFLEDLLQQKRLRIGKQT